MDNSPHMLTCFGCGTTRPSDLASITPRPPCPKCGSVNVNIGVSLHAELTQTASVSATLTPSDQARGWERRWKEIERKGAALFEPRPGGMSADLIHAAHDELQTFYISCYHLKDSLISEAASTGVDGQTIERAITANPALALLADLANLDKHAKLNTRPRNGHLPKIAHARSTSTESGWRLDLTIVHAGVERDGLTVAAEAVDAWKLALTGWGLL